MYCGANYLPAGDALTELLFYGSYKLHKGGKENLWNDGVYRFMTGGMGWK